MTSTESVTILDDEVYPQAFVAKPPLIETYRFTWGTTDVLDIQAWLGGDYTVHPHTMMPAAFIQLDGTTLFVLHNNNYVARDQSGNVYPMTRELVHTFYDKVVEDAESEQI